MNADIQFQRFPLQGPQSENRHFFEIGKGDFLDLNLTAKRRNIHTSPGFFFRSDIENVQMRQVDEKSKTLKRQLYEIVEPKFSQLHVAWPPLEEA